MSPLKTAGYRLLMNNHANFYRLGPRLSRRCLKLRSLVQLAILLVILYICYILGLFTHMLERDLADFRYPLKIDINIAIKTLKKDEASQAYLDVNKVNFTFVHRAEQACQLVGNTSSSRRPYMVILVKSKYSHFENRETIRQTWGKSDAERLIRTVFLIGMPSPDELVSLEVESSHEHHQHHDELEAAKISGNSAGLLKGSIDENSERDGQDLMVVRLKGKRQSLLKRIQRENEQHGDIVQQDFLDTYYNNTLKTLMGLRWVNEYCTTSTFYLFIDDDYYLNPNLLVDFLEANVTKSVAGHDGSASAMSTLYAGFVFPKSAPMRHIMSKWYISLKEYPYNRYPPYVSAGCYIMSLESVRLFYMASKLIETFKLDDIYMGILAHKLEVRPLHIPNIYFYPPTYEPEFFAKSVMASHQFENEALKSIWTELESVIKFTGFRSKRKNSAILD